MTTPTPTPIEWHAVTRNCHVGEINDIPVVTVERPQRRRFDGEHHDWSIVVLGDRYTWNKTFCHHDPRDLESTKSGAEARVRWAIESLHEMLSSKTKKTKTSRK